ncbi:MAG: hypothetical protein IT376_03730 [Polyangiaceae bacterium]|nr:hypothetical protein [Polyangiaceae bacterium]
MASDLLVRAARAAAAALAIGAAGCGGAAERGEPATPRGTRARPKPARVAPGMPGPLLATVPSGTYGPYLARGEDGAVAVWAAGEPRAWYAAHAPATGRIAEAVRVADAPAEVGVVALRSLGAAGYVLAYTTRTEPERVEALLIDARGEVAGPARALEESSERALWIDALPIEGGALVAFARQRGKGADLLAAAVGIRRPPEPPVALATGALAWQLVATPPGGALATVTGDGPRGRVSVLPLSAAGAPAGSPVPLSAHPTAEPDLDAVATPSGLVLAWTDRASIEPRVHVAATDARGALARPPAPVTLGAGEETLVGLVAPHGTGPVYLAWERPAERVPGERSVELGELGEGLKLGGRARITAYGDETLPELAASPRGLAALTLARACRRGVKCDEVLPTFVELGAGLAPVSSEPVRLSAAEGAPAALAWGLGCTATGCTALAAPDEVPAPVHLVSFARASLEHEPAAVAVTRPEPPTIAATEVIAASEPLAAIAGVPTPSGALVAYLTHFEPTGPWKLLDRPAADGRREPLQARLELVALDAAGRPAAPVNLSLRAGSYAGVAVVSADPARGEHLVVWSAYDLGQPQVFATLVAADGRKLAQRMITTRRGALRDLTAARVADGYVLAWVDERDGDAEVYLAKLNPQLQRIGLDQRVTRVTGAAGQPALLVRGAEVLVVWSDARDPDAPGRGDLYAWRRSARDLTAIGAEERVAKTPEHSRSPSLAALGDRPVVAWIEQAPEGAAGEGRLRVAELDGAGRVLGASTIVELPGGSPSDVALRCGEKDCRVVVAVEDASRSSLWGFGWAPGGEAKPSRLGGVAGPAGQLVAPRWVGDALVHLEHSRPGSGRVRRAVLEW